MTTSASPASTSASAEAAAATAAPASDTIALKIRTLDQKTYPIVVRTDASVPQLKEVVASETGVVLARQRLIFRGKVLKNDQSIAAYALEDGHVVHLVVRAEEAVAAEAEQQQRQQQQQQQATAAAAGASRGATRNRTVRNNDEPDPTVGLSPRPRVVMGATIAVPDDMPMPFLNSMIANFVNSMGTAAVGAAGGAAAAAGGGLPGAADDAQRTQRNRDLLRRLRRARNNVSNAVNDAGASTGGSRRRARDGSDAGESMSFANSLSGSMLRDSAESQLRRLEQSLSNQSFDLPELQPRDEAEGTATEVNRNDEVVQAQLAQLRGYIEQFGPRMDRLPAALREIGWYARQNQEAPHDLVSSTVRAIDTLQSVGDSASTIARFARHVFLANSPDIPAPMVRIDDRGTLRASLSFPIMGGGVLPPNALPRTRAERQQTRGLQPIPRASTSNANGSVGNNDDATAAAGSRESPGVLRSLYQRVTSGLLGTGGSDTRSESETATSAAANPGSPAVLHPDDDGDVGMNRFTISALSGPFHPVFPMSFSGGGLFPSPDRTNRPEWDIIGLWQRLVRDLRAGTAFGILRGDPVALYDLMRSLATIFVAGVYTPSLTSTPVRVWARRFLIAVRRVLSEQTIPAQILNLTMDRSPSRLVEELTRPLDPFMPELVDHIRRSNSASQGDVFGRSCTDFLRNMAIQFLERVRTYCNGDEAYTTRLLEGILVALDVDQGLATYVVAKLIEFSSPVPPAGRATDGDAPATKRARREGC